MLKIGIRAHDVGKMPLDELLKQVKALGFQNIQLVIYKTLPKEDGFLEKDKAIEYHNILSKYNVNVAMLGDYFNPVHSNKELLNYMIERFKNNLEFCNYLGTKNIGTETGSYNDDEWTYNPKNHTEEAYDEALKVFKNLADYAEIFDSNVVIEGAYNHVIYNPKTLRRFVDDIGKKNVKVTIDLFNFLNINNHEKRYEILEECLNLFKDEIVNFHLKDYQVIDNKLVQVGLGQGLMDYPKIIKMIKEKVSDAYLIFEGITGDNIKTSLSLIKSLI